MALSAYICFPCNTFLAMQTVIYDIEQTLKSIWLSQNIKQYYGLVMKFIQVRLELE